MRSRRGWKVEMSGAERTSRCRFDGAPLAEAFAIMSRRPAKRSSPRRGGIFTRIRSLSNLRPFFRSSSRLTLRRFTTTMSTRPMAGSTECEPAFRQSACCRRSVRTTPGGPRVSADLRGHTRGRVTGRLLDVGAGIGVFPAVMKACRLGHRGDGTDCVRQIICANRRRHAPYGDHCIAQGRDRAVRHRDLQQSARARRGSRRDARRCGAELLTARGHVYVEVPDVAAAQDGPRREEFFIEHLHVFSPISLGVTIERAGFRLIELERLREPSGKFSIFAFAELSS